MNDEIEQAEQAEWAAHQALWAAIDSGTPEEVARARAAHSAAREAHRKAWADYKVAQGIRAKDAASGAFPQVLDEVLDEVLDDVLDGRR